jgi:hypothetical protein
MQLIREGEIGLAWWGEEPLILSHGRHYLLHPTLHLARTVPLTNEHIEHGPIHIIRVEKGKLGCATDTTSGQPMLLVAGTHYIRKAEFKWNSFLDLTKPVNEIGVLKLIRVDRGEVGYFYRKGEYVSYPSFHFISSSFHFIFQLSCLIFRRSWSCCVVLRCLFFRLIFG